MIRALSPTERPLLGRVRPLAALALLIALLSPMPAAASPDTLRRGFGNLINGPIDMILFPVTGTMIVAENLTEIDDSTGVRLAYAIPGLVWMWGLQLGAGTIRTITGALESAPGVLLFPFPETDLDPLFDPVEDASAFYEWENPLADAESAWVRYNPILTPFSVHLKFGMNYTRADF